MGIGGDYPLSATIMSEFSNVANRGAFVGSVFAMQGVGILCSATVALAVTSIFSHAFPAPPFGTSVEAIRASTPPEADFVWRIVLAFGGVFAMLTMWARSSMPETPRWTLMVKRNVEKAASDIAGLVGQDNTAGMAPLKPPMDLRTFLRLWWKPLVGCSLSWFFLDIAFYSQNLHQKDVFTAVGWIPAANKMNALDETWHVARAQALIALGSTVPGYWFTVAFVDKIGRIPIQLGGFAIMTVLLALLSGFYDVLVKEHPNVFVAMCASAGAGPLGSAGAGPLGR